MRTRTRVSVGAAALGALCLLLTPFARPAVAAEAPLPIYDARAIGQGVVLTFAVKPSIFDPLLQAGTDYVESTFSSQGGGIAQSIASPLFPGKFAMGALTGAVGCGGLKGWVEARFPPTEKPTCKTESEDSFVKTDSIGDRLDAGVGLMRATAGPDNGSATITSGGMSLRSDAATPVLEVGEMILKTTGARAAGAVAHTVQVTAKNVRLLDGAITIGAIVSTATTGSDGTTGTAQATMAFADVFVDANGSKHRATIDNRGIHVTDPALDRDQRLGIQEQLDDALLRAGISISSATPSEITNGPEADAAIGGLMLTFAATAPAVPIPQEAAPVYGTVIDEIPTKCVKELMKDDTPPEVDPIVNEAPDVPLCFGSGIIPAGGSEPAMTLAIATAQAFTVAARVPVFETPDIQTPPFEPGGPALPPFDGGTLPGPTGPGPVPPPTGPTVTQPQPALVGLIARLPAVALVWAAAAFLVLAVGSTLVPSLRHAGQR